MGMFSQLAQGVDWSSMGQMILRIAAVLLCLVIHEVSHGLAAYHLGDPTAKQSHRLSLNPLRHLDPFGLIMMIAVGFGWAKPVPINPRYFRHFNRDMMLTALAGPASNLLQAIGWAVVLKLVVMLGISERFVISVCAAGISVNLMLMAFNLIPIPPLDGGRILRGLLPSSGRSLLDRIEPYGMVILVVLMAGGGLGFFARPFLEAGRWLVELVL